ncbi:Fungal specific transcription factor domain-containing protein isoform 4 [Cladophialophora immunda]|nr:Fungal specific transcription factor domain-containing protein isoform 4 [Cladophialophora immunda]
MAETTQLREKSLSVGGILREHVDDAELDEWGHNVSENLLAQTSLFSLTQPHQPEPSCSFGTCTGHGAPRGSRKRPRDSDDAATWPPPVIGSDEQSKMLRELFPELFPQSPSIEGRHPFQARENPYLEGQSAVTERHSCLRRVRRLDTGVVNGYLKFIMRSTDHNDSEDFSHRVTSSYKDMAVHHRNPYMPEFRPEDNVTRLPQGFGSNAKIDKTDRKILRFYTAAICGGRTLLPKTNAWLDLGSVIDSDECARHAALAFSAGYMLDYIPSERLRVRANFHYKKASELLTLALANPNIYEVGKEDGVVTALHLLWSDDIVQWELRRPKDKKPRWRCGTQTAKAILDDTDPGYRYWHPENVQVTSTRRSNANMCAYAEICALPITELCIADIDKLYPWLLGGSEEDVREIHGGTGVCPKILHIYAQITQLSARIMEDPDSSILPHAADAIMTQLTNFRQVSELSRGYETTDELLNACILDDRALVQCATKVTELTAETWVQAAQIYLCCRFYRMPRYHPKVLQSLSVLLRCVERMPTSGELFTAQSPFFCIFMAALVAYRHEDRLVLRNWFDAIVSGASGRSIAQEFWIWIDVQHYAIPKDDVGDFTLLSERTPWWENMVEWLLENYGELSLV